MSGDHVPAIKVENLKKYYGTTKAVDGISFCVERGEVFGMLGPNRAGKSTTTEIIEGLRVPDAGEVHVLGMDVRRDTAKVKSRIGTTPLPRTTLLAAQVTHRLTIGVLQTFIIIVTGVLLFNVHMGGNWLVLLAVVLLGALMFVAMGYFISGLARTQDSATGISQVINFPMMFLSGIFFPVGIMPAWLQPVIALLPLTYLGDALRQIMVQAPPANSMGFDLLMLACWMVVCGVLAVRLFRWE